MGRLRPRDLHDIRYLFPYVSAWQYLSPDDQYLILSRFKTFYVSVMWGWFVAAKHAQDPEGQITFGTIPDSAPATTKQVHQPSSQTRPSGNHDARTRNVRAPSRQRQPVSGP